MPFVAPFHDVVNEIRANYGADPEMIAEACNLMWWANEWTLDFNALLNEMWKTFDFDMANSELPDECPVTSRNDDHGTGKLFPPQLEMHQELPNTGFDSAPSLSECGTFND